MKRHYVESKSVMLAYTACGIHRAFIEPAQETKIKAKVDCKNCKKALHAREKAREE